MKIKKTYGIALLVSTIALIWACVPSGPSFQRHPVPLVLHSASGEHPITVELAISALQHQHGLMYRKQLPENEGMLFLLPNPHSMQMWMKNTLIPLDMVFILPDHTIAMIAHNAVPESLEIIECPEPVSAVLELAGGTAERLSLKKGDRVTHPALKP